MNKRQIKDIAGAVVGDVVPSGLVVVAGGYFVASIASGSSH